MIRPVRLAVVTATVAMLALSGCSSGGSAGPSTPASTSPGAASAASSAPSAPSAVMSAAASAPGSSDSGASAAATGASTGNDRCAKFTTTQVNTLTGDAPFQTSEPGMLDVPGCQWYFSSGVGNVNLQVLPADQFSDWSGKAGVTAVSGVGDGAFVGPFVTGGTMAGARVGDSFYFLTVAPAPSNDVVMGFLKEAIAQLGVH